MEYLSQITEQESKTRGFWHWLIQPIGQYKRERVLWITVGFAAIIGIAGVAIAIRSPDVEKLTVVNIPLSVIWFAILGAVLCCLEGIMPSTRLPVAMRKVI